MRFCQCLGNQGQITGGAYDIYKEGFLGVLPKLEETLVSLYMLPRKLLQRRWRCLGLRVTFFLISTLQGLLGSTLYVREKNFRKYNEAK